MNPEEIPDTPEGIPETSGGLSKVSEGIAEMPEELPEKYQRHLRDAWGTIKDVQGGHKYA